MICRHCQRDCAALITPAEICIPYNTALSKLPDPQPQPRAEMPTPRLFAEVTPALRFAHVGHWLAFYTAGLRLESPANPGISAKRAAWLADAALGRMFKCIPQLAQPAAEDINPSATQ